MQNIYVIFNCNKSACYTQTSEHNGKKCSKLNWLISYKDSPRDCPNINDVNINPDCVVAIDSTLLEEHKEVILHQYF